MRRPALLFLGCTFVVGAQVVVAPSGHSVRIERTVRRRRRRGTSPDAEAPEAPPLGEQPDPTPPKPAAEPAVGIELCARLAWFLPTDACHRIERAVEDLPPIVDRPIVDRPVVPPQRGSGGRSHPSPRSEGSKPTSPA